MSLQVQNLSYIHPNKDVLFSNISFSIHHGEKCAIIGNNGIGKSTLLQIIAGHIPSSSGIVQCQTTYLIPQHFGQFNNRTIAEVLGVSEKLKALASILEGRGVEDDFNTLGDDWTIEEQMADSFSKWGINYLSPDTLIGNLSGGEKTKVFLSGIDLHCPDMVLMDEPTNHLDSKGRATLYDYVGKSGQTILLVSHDRALLNMLTSIYEMTSTGMRFYPMNYQSYKTLRDTESEALAMQLHNKQKELSKIKKTARDTIERQQKHNARGEKRSEKKCVARIAMGNLNDRAETTTSHINKVHEEKLQAMSKELSELRSSIPVQFGMKISIDESKLHFGKRQIEMKEVLFSYPHGVSLWQKSPLNLSISVGDRIRLSGDNGCGKSTLLKLITQELSPTSGNIWIAESLDILYLDQEYSFINNDLSVYKQLESDNPNLPEHELKALLNRFLFTTSAWDKKCGDLSGGEKMKLALCCLLAHKKAPNMIIADEPTNNVDIMNTDILASTLSNYNGTLLVVSHDEQFVKDIGINKTILLN